jgi:hypothetical protein
VTPGGRYNALLAQIGFPVSNGIAMKYLVPERDGGECSHGQITSPFFTHSLLALAWMNLETLECGGLSRLHAAALKCFDDGKRGRQGENMRRNTLVDAAHCKLRLLDLDGFYMLLIYAFKLFQMCRCYMFFFLFEEFTF